jgi:hypothetical protein
MAHDLKLHLDGRGLGQDGIDLPVTPDPSKGGLVVSRATEEQAQPELHGELAGELRGKWGFDSWTGPRFHLRGVAETGWTVSAADQSALVVGRDDVLHLEGESTLCVERVEAHGADGNPLKVAWKANRPEQLELTIPMKDVPAGPVGFSIFQYGRTRPVNVTAKAYADAASLESFALNAGDQEARLKGTRLDEVAAAELNGLSFTPAGLHRVGDSDQLALKTSGATAGLAVGSKQRATVTLRDGRMLKIAAAIEPPRPQVTLANKGVQPSGALVVEMGSPDDLPLEGRLVFFLKSAGEANFPRDARVEVAAVDGSFRTILGLADGSLMLADAHTAMGSLEPLVRFGASAFGPVQVRVLASNGTASDWLPLGTLVRLPSFKELRCPRAASKPCILTGSHLFLATAFSATRDFASPAEVPAEFTGTQIAMPHTVGGVLYVRLRDDPSAVATLTLQVTPIAGDPAPAAPSVAAPAVPVPVAPVPAGAQAPPATQPAETGPSTPQP